MSASVTDLVARAEARQPSVDQRIERRLDILRTWLSEGIAAGKNVPRSLNAARRWGDPELGIEPIASPNDFTTTHPIFGSRVRDIAGLLTALRKKFDRPPANSPASARATKFDRKALERLLQTAVSQWHSERDARLQDKKRADSAEARSVLLIAESAQKDELIADLRRQLASQRGLKVVG